MSGFVITLVGYIPSPRFDSVPWTQAQVFYSPDGVQAYALLDTLTLSPADSDPTRPATRNITITNSPTASGWFTVTFLDAGGNQEPTTPVQFPSPTGAGAANPSVLSARYAVRHRIRDGVPMLDANPVPFNTVRLENLTGQVPIVPTPVQTRFQVLFEDVPTARYMQANVVPNTLQAYIDGSWVPTIPTVDADSNGNFLLPVAPVTELRISYAWQYLSDGEIDYFVDEARRWLRKFATVPAVPDGLGHALASYAASLAMQALARSATLANVRAGDSGVDWDSLAKSYLQMADGFQKEADYERTQFYTQGAEALDPTAVDASAPSFSTYTPIR